MKAFFSRNWFIACLPLIILAAFLAPQAGANGGWLQSQVTTKLGVGAIFALQGLTIPLAALRKGLKNWRLHLLVQAFIFALYPLLGLVFDKAVGERLPAELRLGFLYLCVLPSTISTSPVLTAAAGGNTIAAIFNAVLSNLLGLALTPLWAAWLMKTSGQSGPMAGIMRDVALMLFGPFLAGQASRQWLAEWADRQRRRIGNVCSGVILFIVFAAFCNSVKNRVWQEHGWEVTAAAAAGAVTLFLVSSALAEGVAVLMRLDPGDRIVAVFSGPHKSLASGLPMAGVIFGTRPGLGLILLPLMFYHPLQLSVCGVIAQRLARRREALAGASGAQPHPPERSGAR